VLRRGVGLLFASAAVSAAAATQPAHAASSAWTVTVEGTQTTVVTRVARGIDDLGCTVRRNNSDTQTLRFATSRAARLLVRADGRAAPARIPVAVVARGTQARERRVTGGAPDCDSAPRTSARSCGPAAVAGHVSVRLPVRSVVALGGSLDRRRDRGRCAPALAPARPFLPASEGRFEGRRLDDPRAARITLSGSMRFVDHVRGGARRVTTIRWTILLRRTS
jgi:hypothetical protein